MAIGIFVGIFIFIAVTLFLIAGFILLVRGIRGYASLSDPYCAKCGYDLRGFAGTPPATCSECGSDLTRPYAIRLARRRRDNRSITIGAAALMIALVVLLGGYFTMALMRAPFNAGNNPNAIAAQTNVQIIANLPTTANSPWAWQELERRLAAGKLPTADASAAIDGLIVWLQKQNNASPQPLSWSDHFIAKMNAANSIPPAQFDRLVDAFFGMPRLRISQTLHPYDAVPFELAYGGPWDLIGQRSIFALRSVVSETGVALMVAPRGEQKPSPSSAKRLSGGGPFAIDADLHVGDLPIGQHQLTVTVDTAAIDQTTQQLIESSQPGPASQWPSNVVARPRSIVIPVTVTSSDTPTLELITDTTAHPWPPVTLKSVNALPGDSGTRIKLFLNSAAGDVDYLYDVTILVDGKKYQMGTHDQIGRIGSYSDGQVTIKPALSPNVTTATILLTPAVDRAKQTPGVTRIWNVPIEMKGVPLSRLDLRVPGPLPP